MSLELCVLGSGSAGNSTVVRCPGGAMLIDIGLGPRTIARRLAGTHVGVADVRAVCLTHLDSDHFNTNWLRTIARNGIRVHCHADLAGTVGRCDPAIAPLVAPFDGEAFEPLPGLRFRAIHLPHDEAGSHGFLIDGFGVRVGYATDLGRVPAGLLELFCDLDVLAIESNYDPRMQRDSDRPWFLKQRIMGGRGHLSNEQSFEAVRTILDRCERCGGRMPRHILLLHRSRDCNCPDIVRRLFSRDLRVSERLILAEQDRCTDWIRLEA